MSTQPPPELEDRVATLEQLKPVINAAPERAMKTRVSAEQEAQFPSEPFSITRTMLAAGVHAAKECCYGEGLETLVYRVFIAMRTEELDPH